MRSLREIRESPSYKLLKKSAELHAAMRLLLIIGGIFLCSAVLLVLPVISAPVRPKGVSYAALYFILFLSLLTYAAYRVVILFLHIDRYVFTEALLDQPHQSGQHFLYFTVTLRDSKGREFKADTRPIFSPWDPNFEDYVNQKALIGYNEVTKQVAVIHKITDLASAPHGVCDEG